MRAVQILIQLVIRAVAYLIRYVPTNDDIRSLAKRLLCSPKELADELHMKSALFGQTGGDDEIREHLIYEWFDEDPYASSIQFIVHLMNLDELDTIEWWVKNDLTPEERAIIDRYHLGLLSTRYPSPAALVKTAQVIIYGANQPKCALIAVSTILKDFGSTSGIICALQNAHTSNLVLELQGKGFGSNSSFRRAAEVLKMRALTELNLCALPTEDGPVSDVAYGFVVRHLVHSSLPSNMELPCPLLQQYDSYLELLSRLKFLNQHYAIAMVLMMTGSSKRNSRIKNNLSLFHSTASIYLTLLNNED